jgi:hypothetical protein
MFVDAALEFKPMSSRSRSIYPNRAWLSPAMDYPLTIFEVPNADVHWLEPRDLTRRMLEGILSGASKLEITGASVIYANKSYSILKQEEALTHARGLLKKARAKGKYVSAEPTANAD